MSSVYSIEQISGRQRKTLHEHRAAQFVNTV